MTKRSRLKVAILYDTWDDGAEEPTTEVLVEEPAPRRRRRKGARSRRVRRPKLDREEVFEALGKLGHQPVYLAIDGADPSLLAVAKTRADLIFNLCESYAGDDTKDMNVAAYLDLLDLPYTGAGPQGLYLAQNKSLAKKILGKSSAAIPSNARREEYNALIRSSFPGEPLFDLARVESTDSSGSPVAADFDGKAVPMLAAEYTPDGGHLNPGASKRAALALVDTLAGAFAAHTTRRQ